MHEFALIDQYFKRQQASSITLGIGDDCAIMDIDAGEQLVFSIDSLVCGTHFFRDDQAEDIATRSLCVALSDLAAMGAQPRCFTLALSLPEADETWLAEFSRGLFAIADTYGCELVGGDTVRGPLQITIQVHGTVPRGQALLRSGAHVGDIICVSGTLGDGGMALNALKSADQHNQAHHDYLLERFYRPTPRFDIGNAAREFANAAIDISDGLVADLNHICVASKVGAELDTEKIPRSPTSHAIAEAAQARQWSLYGGDDYQLCFTVTPAAFNTLVKCNPTIDVSAIGTVTRSSGIRCANTGVDLCANNTGYQHFSDANYPAHGDTL